MIPKIPELPDKIKEAVNNRTLAVFIGAGVSRLIGCMGWDQLARNLVERCYSTKKKNGSGLINFKERETLFKDKDPKKTITICYYLLKENDFEDIFYEELKESFKAKEYLLKSQNIYKELYRLRGLFITTNIDNHFHRYFEPTRIVYKEDDFTPSNIDINKLYYIHGCLWKDKNSIVFTVPQYIKRYNNTIFKKFLKTIFDKYTVLFVGYGLAEFELLDFLITKFDPKKEKELKHFILLPFYRGEENILEFERYYYNSMGIEVLPYEKDEKGYGQLYDVIKEWNREINQVSTYLYDTYKEIEDAANNYTEDKEEEILQIIRNDESLRNHFFKKLALSPNPFPWIKQLKERGYFGPKNNPPPQEAYWNVLEYLENVAAKNEETPLEEITNALLEIINSIISYRDEIGKRIENYRTDKTLVKIIFSLPIEKITKDHIEFVRTALSSKWNTTLVAAEISKTILPKLLDKKEDHLILQLLDVILDYRKIKKKPLFDEKETYEYTSLMDEYWLKEALIKHKQIIAKLCGIEAAKIAIYKIKSIIKDDKSQFNNIWIPTIEDHPQTSFPERYDCQLVYFVRDMFELSEPQKIKKEIESLLKEEHLIFNRIAIHIINFHYKDLNKLFWSWKDNPLEESFLKHELYELLKNNGSTFSKEQINKVLQWIETKQYYISKEIKDNKDQVEKILAYRKKEWLSALLDTGDENVLSTYEKYDQINPSKLDHPGFIYWKETETTWGYESSVAKEELLDKSNEEIADHLINFKGTGCMDIEELSDMFRNWVAENPEKFTNNIKPFLNVPCIYLHALLWGFNEAWRSKKKINWQVVFDFILKLLTLDDFWNEEYKDLNYRNWIISQIAELIKEGTKDDNHAFDPELLPEAQKILLILVEKTKSDLPNINDLVISVLNSPKGKIFSAMINYSLRYARLYNRDREEKWVDSIKEDFTKRLNRELEPSLEFSVILGEYLPNIYWLDGNWVIDNINKIFPKDNETHWEAALTGYLSYSSKVYKDLYFLLRKNEHYTKALKTEFTDSNITERLVQHICIAYLEDWENIEDKESLISQLIENKNINQLLAIESFFWMLRDKLIDKIKTKVKPLWKNLYELVRQNEEKPDFQELISNLSEWLSLIDEIDDEIYEWLRLSAKYVDREFNTPTFVEYLLKHAPKTPTKVGKIFLEMLNANIYPDYKNEYIREIVRVLYNKNEREIADRICNLYLEKGFDFLKDIYETQRDNKA
ncbi:SIR2 family protein [Carboxydothermus pertinax]|uniref:Uncharacterized protein n=1 Tax=Carboxydothermus pertinax TaxID=870242 RepID=A0A1L8CXC8_9THEO|nr:SIR2 family protein [Carboxydothermus pertinax]GAV23531.1 hypothetical protein cpu_20410 [Carboxydothermus pertinax]